MELQRCRWCNPRNPRYIRYHDAEWGRPVHEDALLFEQLLLEPFQAGLSWETILNKREAFRAAFDGFDPERISRYGEDRLAALMADPGIVRNRRKLEAAVINARIFLAICAEFGSFDAYLMRFTGGQTVREWDRTHSPLSDAITRDLKARGMKFIGTTTIYAYLQAVGVIDSHEPACFLFHP